MILLDFSQTIISGLMMQLKITKGDLSEDMLRHMVLNSIRAYQKKYSAEYGKITLCCDSKQNWRKLVFPAYKANRKKTREADGRDWGAIFKTLDKIKLEISENLPYHFMQVEKAEADDIIAVLTKKFQSTDKVLIISGDKDFQQLQKYPSVRQWSPNLQKFVKPSDPKQFLFEHILRGDKSDGIPNILSDDECIVQGQRQKPLKKTLVEQYIKNGMLQDDKYYRNFRRNQVLIDLEYIPEALENDIMNQFSLSTPPSGKIFNYLRVNRLNDLMDNIGDFSL